MLIWLASFVSLRRVLLQYFPVPGSHQFFMQFTPVNHLSGQPCSPLAEFSLLNETSQMQSKHTHVFQESIQANLPN